MKHQTRLFKPEPDVWSWECRCGLVDGTYSDSAEAFDAADLHLELVGA